MSYLGLVVITIATSAFAAYHFSELASSVGRILQENYGSVLAAENMVKSVERQENAVLLFLSGDTTAAHLAFMEHREQFWRWYGEAVTGSALPEEPTLLDSIEVAYDRYLTASDVLFRSIRDGGGPEQADREELVRELAARLRELNLQLLSVNHEAILATRRQVEALSAKATTAVLSAALLAGILSLLAGLYFTRRLIHPIERLTRTVRQIREGHLDLKVDIQTNDEVEELGREFNQMTERLQAYEAMNVMQLIAEKKKSESLVETMPSPVIVTDDDGRVLLLNDAALRLLGIDRRSWFEQPLSSVVINRELEKHLTARPLIEPEAAADGDGPVLEYVFALEEDEHVRYFHRRQSHIRLEEDEGLTVTLLEDVTRFKEVDRLKSDFLAAVSHELRTPLTSLGIALGLLLDEVPGALNAVQRDLLETAQGDQTRLKRLVGNLLDLARMESGTYVPAVESIRFESVLEEALAPLRLAYQTKGVQLEKHLDPDLIPVKGEAQHLAWVITNLVGNALRYTPPGGRVEIEARQVEGMIEVAVRDTGSGIHDEALDSIFDAFVQLKDSDESTPGSLGLGLALARRVVQAHGGRIWAESRPAVGSTFFFTLPSVGAETWNV